MSAVRSYICKFLHIAKFLSAVGLSKIVWNRGLGTDPNSSAPPG
jgi:hypothetical protein